MAFKNFPLCFNVVRPLMRPITHTLSSVVWLRRSANHAGAIARCSAEPSCCFRLVPWDSLCAVVVIAGLRLQHYQDLTLTPPMCQ